MPTLLHADIDKLTASKIDIMLDRVNELKGNKAKNETALLALTSDEKRLVDAKKKIIDFVTKEKRKAEKGVSGAKWSANWRTTVTYKDAVKKGKINKFIQKKNAVGDTLTQFTDFLEDHKQAILATGITAAVAGAAINYVPKILSIETGKILEDGAKETVWTVLKNFMAANPALTAGLGIAGLAAVAVTIPTIRNKVRNSESYLGKTQARRENAELKADILDLNASMPKEAVDFYTEKGVKIDGTGKIEIDQEIINQAANPDVIAELNKLYTDEVAKSNTDLTKMRPDELLKLGTLLTRAQAQWNKIVEAEEKARIKFNTEIELNQAIEEAAKTQINRQDAQTAIPSAFKDFEELKIKKAEAEADQSKQAEYENKLNELGEKLGILKKPNTKSNGSNQQTTYDFAAEFKKTGTNLPLTYDKFAIIQKMIEQFEKNASMSKS